MNFKTLVATFIVGGSLFADVVVPNGPWQTVTTPPTVNNVTEVITSSVNTNGTSTAYWNNASNDGTGCKNIGCFVTGSGFFAGNPVSPALADPFYLGNNDGSAVSDFYLTAAPTAPGAVLLIEIAGDAPNNFFGWYDATLNPSDLTTANKGTAWDIIFTGADTAGATELFTPTGNFGFWLTFGDPTANPAGINYFTESNKQSVANDKGVQKFALFSNEANQQTFPKKFWLGAEDLRTTSGDFDGDFNDMILSFTVVPEPGYYALLGVGLAGLALARKRVSKNKV